MKGEDLLKIIGDIDDKYIRECEAYKPRDKKKIFAVAKYVAAAASVCLLVASFVLLVRIDNRGGRVHNMSTQQSGTFTGPYKDMVYYDEWLEDFQVGNDMESGADGTYESTGNILTENMASGDRDKYMVIINSFFLGAQNPLSGYVCITEQLMDIYRIEKETERLIAVYVEERSGISEIRVYEEFIKPLNVSENYMRNGVIYISPKQMTGLTCPKDMMIVLDVVRK